jgi:hypothetical protein
MAISRTIRIAALYTSISVYSSSTSISRRFEMHWFFASFLLLRLMSLSLDSSGRLKVGDGTVGQPPVGLDGTVGQPPKLMGFDGTVGQPPK